MQKLCKILIIIFTGGALISQTLPVQLISPPPYQFRLEDMWNLSITNNRGNSISIYLHGTATEAASGLIADAVTGIFSLPVGVKHVSSGDVGKVKINQSNKTYDDVINHLSALPTGSYEICVDVIDAATGSIIGNSCISHEVLNVSQVRLVYPEYDQLVLQDNLYPVFSWLPLVPVPHGQAVTYSIKMAEIAGMQSAYDAMQSNPLFYSQKNIVQTAFQYPVAARPFKYGSKYGWQVQAFVNGVMLSETEVWEFIYGAEKQKPVNTKSMKWMESSWSVKDAQGEKNESEIQKKLPDLRFSFNSTLYGESANRSGTGSEISPRFGYWELTPSLSIYGLPVSTNILLSSENSSSRQNINSLSLNLDATVISDFVAQKTENEKEKIASEEKKDISAMNGKELDKLEYDAKSRVMKRLNPVLKFMSYFNSLGIGTNYPSYTQFTIQGVPVTGLNAEFNPGLFYAAFAASKNQKPVENAAFRRDIYSARIGFGKKDKSHVFLTGMYTTDKAGSINLIDTNRTLAPNTNYVFGIEGKLCLLRERLSIEGEIAGSMLTRDNRDNDLENSAIPKFVKDIFHPKISSQVDYSYMLKTTFTNEKSNTKLSAGVRMLGPGYTTLGNPALRGDRLELEGKAEQKFIGKQVTVTGFIRWSRDNLINSKSATTFTTVPGLILGFRFKSYPYLILTYIPNFMSNNQTNELLRVNYKNHMLTAITGHSLRLGKLSLLSSLSYLFNKAASLDTASAYTANSLTVSEALSFQIPLTVSAGLGLSHTKYANEYIRIASVEGNVSYTLEGTWTNILGASASVDRDRNKKTYIYLSSIINITKNLTFDIRAEKSLYTDWLSGLNNYDEFLIKGTVTANW